MRNFFTKRTLKRLIIASTIGIILIPTIIMVGKRFVTYYILCPMSQFFTPTHVTYNIQHIYNQSLCDQIKHYVTQKITTNFANLDQNALSHDIKKRFPIIMSIGWQFSISRTLEIIINGVMPYCIINNQYILGNKKRLFDKAFFSSLDPSTVHHVTIDNQWILKSGHINTGQVEQHSEKLDSITYQFLQNIPDTMWQTFAITYHSPNNIELIPYKSACGCRIITDKNTFFDIRKFDSLNAIFYDLCKRGHVTNKILRTASVPFAFDFRIKDQVIVKFYQSRLRGKGI